MDYVNDSGFSALYNACDSATSGSLTKALMSLQYTVSYQLYLNLPVCEQSSSS